MPHPLDRPLTRQKQKVIEHVNMLRGMLIGSYSHVEYLIGSIWLSMEDVAPYHTRGKQFPYRVDSRIAAVRPLFETDDGPLLTFRDEALKLLGEFDDHALYRNMMAHGYMEVINDDGDYSIRVRYFRPTKEDTAGELHEKITLNRLKADAAKAADFCGRFMRLVYDIHERFGWVAPASARVSSKTAGVVLHDSNKGEN